MVSTTVASLTANSVTNSTVSLDWSNYRTPVILSSALTGRSIYLRISTVQLHQHFLTAILPSGIEYRILVMAKNSAGRFTVHASITITTTGPANDDAKQ